jgi:hypothetical protein
MEASHSSEMLVPVFQTEISHNDNTVGKFFSEVPVPLVNLTLWIFMPSAYS